MTLDRRLATTAGLSLVGLGVAIYLTVVHYTGGEPVCGISHGCETVQTSRYAELAGIPVAILGLVGYAGILLATLIPGESGRTTRVGLAAIGFLFSAYLTYLELFVIDAICQWCVASAILMTALLALTAYDFLSPSARYSSLADSPVSSATTAAAGRNRAPASTNR